jgi:hypothetical protein
MEAAPLQGSSCPVPKMPHSDALEGSRYISHSLWTQLRDSAQCSDFSHDLCLQAREREVASLLLDQWNWELKGASVSVPCYPLQLHCIFTPRECSCSGTIALSSTPRHGGYVAIKQGLGSLPFPLPARRLGPARARADEPFYRTPTPTTFELASEQRQSGGKRRQGRGNKEKGKARQGDVDDRRGREEEGPYLACQEEEKEGAWAQKKKSEENPHQATAL